MPTAPTPNSRPAHPLPASLPPRRTAPPTASPAITEPSISLLTEDLDGFQALKQSLADEHQPITETEAILVNSMAESHWLANRAQSRTYSCLDPLNGHVANQKLFALYLRYQTTHTRAFHKSVSDLLKLRAEKRKVEIGFEAQKRQAEAQHVKTEQHEMKKQAHYWEVLKKDAQACHQIAQNTLLNLNATKEHPGFQAQYADELAQHGLHKADFQVATAA
jgi:hypothetical protein